MNFPKNKKDYYIDIISRNSDRYGNRLIELMETSHKNSLRDITEAEAEAYCKTIERDDNGTLQMIFQKRLEECYIEDKQQRREFARRWAYSDYAEGRIRAQDGNNRCVYCDSIIPERRMICPSCEIKIKETKQCLSSTRPATL